MVVERYLDVGKSVIISSPAGSGKTEKLARRYIGLLKAGSDVQKILAITFTEKAAAEMKQRVLDILAKEEPEIMGRIRAGVPLMRISTIHSFCLRLLKRFSIELGLDPSLSVMDEMNSWALWSSSVFECLEAEKDSPSLFYEMMKDRGLRGRDGLIKLIDELFRHRPAPDIILREGPLPEGIEEKKILSLYAVCLREYEKKKLKRHSIDFSDLEVLAYEALSRGPEWHNILYAFDEHTDHILVDEFQDTSTLQWKIIDKLTEEWRSGVGAKRDSGGTPTIFLVGDDKQSIYQFRGANAAVFNEAKQRFSEWLGDEYRFEEVKENYRSLPEIITFANSLFEKLMPQNLLEGWRTKYSPFEAVREGSGRVELVLIEGAEGTKHNRMKEADALSKAIAGMHNSYEVVDRDGSKRPCRFSDMVILLRRRTYLPVFENALRRGKIPFIVQKGMGFYDEPEIAMLREFVSFIIDPNDEYSRFNLLRSPIFGMDYKSLFKGLKPDEKGISHPSFGSWLERKDDVPLSILIEEMLTETGGWSHFWERQRYANVKKFIAMIEALESEGLSMLEIREKLLRQRYANEVSKANVNAEEMNAVRIMTIHAAKGLQFPMVFIPSLDEDNTPKTSVIAIDDEPGGITFSYEPEPKKRKGNAPFERLKQKEMEEEKRLLYVAVTRAMDYLMMLGVYDGKKTHGRLSYIESAFGGTASFIDSKAPFRVLSEADIEDRFKKAGAGFRDASGFMDEPSYTEPLKYEPALRWRTVTEDIDIRARHGDNWVVIGRVMHRVFEELSKGILALDALRDRVSFALREEALNKEDGEKVIGTIMNDFKKLESSGHLNDIILPQEKNSFSELPFNIELGKSVFKGRIDRLILTGSEALVYDYKTFPIGDKEMPELLEKYKFQMDVYKEAVERIFKVKAKAFLLFTHLPLLIEV